MKREVNVSMKNGYITVIDSAIITAGSRSVANAVAIWCSALKQQINVAIMPRLSKCKYANGAIINKARNRHRFIAN